jgi:hypothetical protein
MKLSELPSMLVESIQQDSQVLSVNGRFDRLDGVRESGQFRISRGEYVWVTLEFVDRGNGSVKFTSDRDPDVARLRVGERYTWLNVYWQAPLLEAIADESHAWRRFEFKPSDARYFKKGGVVGWQQASEPLAKDVEDLGVRAGAWDHEHCGLCGTHIDAERPIAYMDDDEQFLCETCYQKYAATHDLSFHVGA